jgi:hypothetical protein
MESLHEFIALGIDSIILAVCIKEYYSYKKTANSLKVSLLFILVDDTFALGFCAHYVRRSLCHQLIHHIYISDSFSGRSNTSH